MKTLRIILACFFFLLVVSGLWSYFVNRDKVTNEDTFPLLSKIKSLASDVTSTGDNQVLPISTGDEIDDVLATGDKNEGGKGDQDTNDISASNLHKEFIQGTLAPDELIGLLEGGYLAGSKRADLIVIQYCDYGNKYCKQANEEETLKTYMNEAPREVQTLTKQFVLGSDDESVLPHRVAICALERGTNKQYMEVDAFLYQQPDASLQDIVNEAEDIGIEDLDECLVETNSMLYLQQEVNRAKKLFAIKALPTYIFLHKDTGAWVMVPGLYEDNEVLPVIGYLLGNK